MGLTVFYVHPRADFELINPPATAARRIFFRLHEKIVRNI
jgi:hypothetical protein